MKTLQVVLIAFLLTGAIIATGSIMRGVCLGLLVAVLDWRYNKQTTKEE